MCRSQAARTREREDIAAGGLEAGKARDCERGGFVPSGQPLARRDAIGARAIRGTIGNPLRRLCGQVEIEASEQSGAVKRRGLCVCVCVHRGDGLGVEKQGQSEDRRTKGAARRKLRGEASAFARG